MLPGLGVELRGLPPPHRLEVHLGRVHGEGGGDGGGDVLLQGGARLHRGGAVGVGDVQLVVAPKHGVDALVQGVPLGEVDCAAASPRPRPAEAAPGSSVVVTGAGPLRSGGGLRRSAMLRPCAAILTRTLAVTDTLLHGDRLNAVPWRRAGWATRVDTYLRAHYRRRVTLEAWRALLRVPAAPGPLRRPGDDLTDGGAAALARRTGTRRAAKQRGLWGEVAGVLRRQRSRRRACSCGPGRAPSRAVSAGRADVPSAWSRVPGPVPPSAARPGSRSRSGRPPDALRRVGHLRSRSAPCP